jgi:hypothetical protein
MAAVEKYPERRVVAGRVKSAMVLYLFHDALARPPVSLADDLTVTPVTLATKLGDRIMSKKQQSPQA